MKKGRRSDPTRQSSLAAMRVGPTQLTDEEIIGYIISNGGEASMPEVLGAFGLGRSYRKELYVLLETMCDNHSLNFTEDKQYEVRNSQDYLKARLSVHPKGFAFAELSSIPIDWPYKDDAFVSPPHTSTAMHGDQVLVKIIGHRADRAEAKVVRVLKRSISKIVGVYDDGEPYGLVTPEDERFPFNIRISNDDAMGAKSGDAVVAVITDHDPARLSKPKGEIIEVLGDPDSLKVQTEIVVRKFDLPHEFSDKTLDQVEKIDPTIKLSQNRTDLRDVMHITIDGETARDFDDAVAVVKTKKGFRLYVSIADVSHYVTPGSPLDQDAYQRGTSCYFPTRVLPMLPERLSNDLCSLVPNQDRYAFSAILDFDRSGNLQKKDFCRSLINSRFRMTYTQVSQILVEKIPAVRRQYKELLTPLKWMGELGEQLNLQRMGRGSIGFEIPEVYIQVGEDDDVMGIARRERNLAHKLIEEFMLVANDAVARTMADHHLFNGLFRIHETPDQVKVAEFSDFAKTLGLKLPDGAGSPQWFGQVLKLAAGQPQEYIVNNLLLRTMKQARYSPDNVGHFGLAASHYCHFTSPIRRYPDLMVHRALGQFLVSKGAAATKQKSSKKKLASTEIEAGEFLSQRERLAVDAEREMIDRMKIRYMGDKIGESFEGIISGVTSFGLFIELLESFISGAVTITDLTDDYYHVDEKNYRLVGKKTKKTYQVGNLVTVKLTSVDKARRRINFKILD